MNEEIQQRAKARMRTIRRHRRDPRFRLAVGRLLAAGLLTTNTKDIEPHSEAVALRDMLWAGRTEPRILELLPAIVLKRPSLLILDVELPEDLANTVKAIRQGQNHPPFRGVQPSEYLPWVKRIGRRGHTPSLLKSFRFQAEDVARLRRLKQALPAKSETEVIRLALRMLEQTAQS